ncbi:MAG TPA: 5'-methylthioadenosine/adenosylhomocysteine nucleosidase [Firmicutes bacterium]|nr:5'-methylthioadenosine/adenosylhomocysteine nucleosidase [Bacillota bacterium]
MDVAFIAAMEEELTALKQCLTPREETAAFLGDLPVFAGSLQGYDVVVVQCGIGKVNAALATQYTIDRFQPKKIITAGVAGALSPKLRIGDVVVGTGAQQHDFDASRFGYARGVIPRLATSLFLPDSRLVELATAAAQEELGVNRVHQGLVVSGDVFVASMEEKQEILEFFPGAMCADMEAAAIAQVAAVNRVPHLILQAMSDQADHNATHGYRQSLSEVLADLHLVVARLVKLLKG